MTGFFHPHPLNDHRLLQQATDLAHAEANTRRVQSEAEELRQMVERLRLATAALWELMSEHHGLSEEVLLERIREIDLRDGTLDGRMRPAPSTCPACQRVNKATRPQCLYCGQELEPPLPI